MTDQLDTNPPGDAEALTAYLDGELSEPARSALEKRLGEDKELAARLATLRQGSRDFRPAFDLLLAAAPSARLDAILAGAMARTSPPVSAPRRSRGLMAIAAALVLFVGGGAIGVFLPRVVPALAPYAPAENWRSVVADYVALYTDDTFAGIPEDVAIQSRQLDAAGGKLGLALDPAKVALPDVALKGAIMFEYRGMPLVQVAYLSPRDGPLAFCIIRNGQPDAEPRFEEREGQNIVFWQKGGLGYLIIGKTPREELEKFAVQLEGRIS